MYLRGLCYQNKVSIGKGNLELSFDYTINNIENVYKSVMFNQNQRKIIVIFKSFPHGTVGRTSDTYLLYILL